MNRFHIALVSLLLAVAAVLGTVAATRTHASTTQTGTNAAYDARVRQLNAFEAQLRRKLAAATQPQAAAPAAKVVYHRPPPVVVVEHSSHHEDGEHESEQEHEDGGDD